MLTQDKMDPLSFAGKVSCERVIPEAAAHVCVDQVEFGKGGFQALHFPLCCLDAGIK